MRCPRCCLVTVEAGCQEEAQKKEAEKKRRQERKGERQVRKEIVQEVGCGHREKGKGADRAKCQAKFGLFANRNAEEEEGKRFLNDEERKEVLFLACRSLAKG